MDNNYLFLDEIDDGPDLPIRFHKDGANIAVFERERYNFLALAYLAGSRDFRDGWRGRVHRRQADAGVCRGSLQYFGGDQHRYA